MGQHRLPVPSQSCLQLPQILVLSATTSDDCPDWVASACPLMVALTRLLPPVSGGCPDWITSIYTAWLPCPGGLKQTLMATQPRLSLSAPSAYGELIVCTGSCSERAASICPGLLWAPGDCSDLAAFAFGDFLLLVIALTGLRPSASGRCLPLLTALAKLPLSLAVAQARPLPSPQVVALVLAVSICFCWLPRIDCLRLPLVVVLARPLPPGSDGCPDRAAFIILGGCPGQAASTCLWWLP